MYLDGLYELIDVFDSFLFDLFNCKEKSRLFMTANIYVSNSTFSQKLSQLKILDRSLVNLVNLLLDLLRIKSGQFC